MKNVFTLAILCLLMATGISAQEVGTTYQPVVSENTYFDVSLPLSEIGPIPPRGASGHHQYKNHPGIPELQEETVYKNLENALPKGDDPAWQNDFGTRGLTQPIVNFQGVRNDDNGGYYDLIAPPDTDGDVGPNHYFQMCNTIFEIFDKNGNTLFGPADNSTIWDGFIGDWTGTNDGDPIVLYDEQADRWLVSQFAVDTDITGGTYWILIAVSTSSNPLGSYYRYAFEYDEFPDYPKFGIWRDGYYLMVQHGNGTATASALNRSQMIAGNATAQRVTFAIPNLPGSGFTSVLPADNDGDWAPVGSPNYFVYFSDDAWGDDPVDRLKVWEFDVNWTLPFFSSLTLTQNLNTASFSSAFGTHNQGIIPQPGTTNKLAVMEKALMNRLQYRNFGTYESMVCCHTVDVNDANRAGTRWYELRKTTGDWYIYQQGTYAPGTTDNYWMASIAQNASGDIALGFSVSSASTYPSIRYTGRKLGDPLGQMTMGEGVIMNGDDSQKGTSRWGDYTMMSVDPSDDETFWYTNEYNDDYTTWGNWITQVASFQVTDLCAASGGCDEYIANVQVGGQINNASGCDGYANYINLQADLPINGSLSMSVVNGLTSYPSDQCGIWIDWNDDSDFEDANETIAVSGSPGVGPYTASLTVPVGVSLGEKIMRVRITYNQSPVPCGANSYGEVEDYTINVTPAVPNIWTGAANHYWHQAGNWSLGRIPTSTDPVEIPNVGYQPVYVDDYPTVANEACKSLVVGAGASLIFYNMELVVQEDANIYGSVTMQQADGELSVFGDIYWKSGSSFDATNSSTFVNVYGNWQADNGSDLTPQMGFVDFLGSTEGYIRSYDPGNTFYNLRVYKNNGAELGLSAFSTQDLEVDNLLFVGPNAAFNSYTSQNILLHGNFNYYGTVDLTGNSNTSTLIMDGGTQQIYNYASGSGVFNNIEFSSSVKTYLYNDIFIDGNVTISQGMVDPNPINITLTGNWTTSVGPTGFDEGESRVIFNGPGHQYIYGSENFNVLEVNNGAALRLNSTAYNVICNTYDWTAGGIDIVAGNFTALDLADNGLYGTYWCNNYGTLTLTQDASQFTDLNGEIHIFGGTMTVHGGNGTSWWPYQNDAMIVMTGGVLNYPDVSIRLSTGYDLVTDITGGTIKCGWSFWDYRGDFTPEGGTLELNGTSDAVIDLEFGSNLYNLTINKIAADGETPDTQKDFIMHRDGTKEPVNRSSSVAASSDLVILNDFNLEAGTFTAPALMRIGGVEGGDWNNSVGPEAFVEGTGTVKFVGSYAQSVSNESFYVLDIEKPNGDLQVWYGNEVDCQTLKWTSTNGEIHVDDGTFTAWDLFDNGIFGKYYLTYATATVNLYQDNAQWVDLNAMIVIVDGTMNIYGGSGTSFWPYAADAYLHMLNGVLNFADQGIYINGGSIYELYVDIDGGVIRTSSAFYGTGDTFQPTAGEVELYGPNDAIVGIDGGSFFNDLIINKGPGKNQTKIYNAKPSLGQKNAPDREEPWVGNSKSNAAIANTDFVVEGSLTIENGIFDVSQYDVMIDNEIDIFGTLKMMNAAGTLTAYYVNWEDGSQDLVDAGNIYCSYWDFQEATQAKLGIGNTAHVNSGLNVIWDQAEFGNLEMGFGGTKFTFPASRGSSLNTLGYAKLLSGANWYINVPMHVGTDFIVEETATFTMYYNVEVENDLILQGTIVFNGDLMQVHGGISWPATGSLTINGGEVIFDAPNHPDKGWEYIYGNLEMDEGLFEITYNSINFKSSSTTSIGGGILRTGGAFHANDPGVFEPTGGTVEIIGNQTDELIYCYNGNYFYNLVINRTPGRQCFFTNSEPVDIKNDLTILSGILNTGSSTMFVGGNWTNNVGPDGFIENENEVWFYGESYSYIYTNETFYDLYIFDYLTDGNGNGAKIVDETYIEDGIVVNATNNCRILGGSLNMGSNSVLNIDKSLIFNGGQLIVPNGIVAEVFVGANYENYNPGQAYFPGHSTLTFDGTAQQDVLSDAPTEYFYNLVIDNPANLVRFDASTHVYGDVNVANGTYVNVGLIHSNTFEGDVNVETTGGFLPKGGIHFTGTENTVFNDQSSITSYLWGDVSVEKSSDNLQLLIADDIIILNEYSIDVFTGVVDLNGGKLRCTKNVTIHDGGKIIVDAGAELEVGEDDLLSVLDGGTLEVNGSPGNPGTVTAWNAIHDYHYYCNIESGGTISASNGIFEYMKAPFGIHVKEGAMIDPANSFNSCEFSNGEIGGSSSLLTINNNQVLTIDNASFPDASANFNVAKDFNQGHITFTNFSGAFSGEDYDLDLFNLIDWYEETLWADPLVQNVGPPAGSVTFDIISNLTWMASESVPWFSISPGFGTGNGILTVNYQENTDLTGRTGIITLSAPGVPDVTLTLIQAGEEPFLSILPLYEFVGPAAGGTTFQIISNTNWQIDETYGWLDALPSSGIGNKIITVDYTMNATGANRIADVFVTANGGALSETYTLEQASYLTHQIEIPAGWSGLSSYIMPAENTITDLMAPLSPNFIILTTMESVFYPDGSINTIGTWEPQSAYKIKLSANSLLDIVGAEESNKTFDLDPGWNLMPVIANTPVDAAGLFTGTGLIIAKDIAGVGLLWPEYGINTLGIFVPGRVYTVKMTSSGAVTFPPNVKNAAAFEITPTVFPSNPWNEIQKGPSTHSIAIVAQGISGAMPGDIIGIFDGSGQCFGIAEIANLNDNIAITAFADDPYTYEKDGFTANDPMSVKVFRPAASTVFPAEVTWDDRMPNSSFFENEGISVIKGFKVSSVGTNELLASSIQIRPNPSNGMVEISGIEKFSRIEIFNAGGEMIRKFDNNEENMMKLNLSDLPSGIYQAKFTGVDNSVIKKLIIN